MAGGRGAAHCGSTASSRIGASAEVSVPSYEAREAVEIKRVCWEGFAGNYAQFFYYKAWKRPNYDGAFRNAVSPSKRINLAAARILVFLQKFTVPQSFFAHFYVLGLIWTTVLFFTALGFAITCSRPAPGEQNLTSLGARLVDAIRSDLLGGGAMGDIGQYGKEAWRLVLVLLLFEIHLTRRLYECLFVSYFDPSARMNFFGYIIALGYYTAVPMTLFLQGFQEEGFVRAFKGVLKQKLRGHGLPSTDAPNIWDMMYFLGRIGWMRYVGAAVCFYGSIHQLACHEILASLRPADKPGMPNKYGIPRGDWFELVSSAHYLAEIVIYAGLLIATGGRSPVMWVLFVSVVANLYLLAKPTHDWYLSKFEDYPKTRHALFPSFKQIKAKEI